MSRKRCRHENADHLMPGDRFSMDDWGPCHVDIARCEQFRCVDCGAWLSLGPSNDEPESVRVEIRAAEIAAAACEPIDEWICQELTATERLGWCGWIDEASLGILAEHAGYLACQIWQHDKEAT